jgi:hypothetical protein
VAVLPARGVPVPAQVGGIEGDDDEMTETLGDLLVAARAQVRLQRLEGLNATYLELVIVGQRTPAAHSSNSSVTSSAPPTIT